MHMPNRSGWVSVSEQAAAAARKCVSPQVAPAQSGVADCLALASKRIHLTQGSVRSARMRVRKALVLQGYTLHPNAVGLVGWHAQLRCRVWVHCTQSGPARISIVLQLIASSDELARHEMATLCAALRK
jgi:hypothetical protein